MEKERKIIGMRIRNLRKMNRLTQEKLCELADIDQSTLSRIENGDVFPALDNFIAILKALHTPPDKVLDFINFNSGISSINDIQIYQAVTDLDEEFKNQIILLINLINKRRAVK